MLELLLGRAPMKSLQALAPLNLEIKRGESLGLIGRNGAGKSTLLQILAGVVAPSGGQAQVNGRVAALLELGAGLAPELTGLENIALSGPLMGLSAEELAEKTPAIIEFSELGDFINQPIRTYSTGMVMRLAFSIATACDPDLLIIDEALSVGDGLFAKKSFDRIIALKNSGASVIFCSHVLYQVERLCERVLWLEKGELKAQGTPDEVLFKYQRFLESLEADLPQTAGPQQPTPSGLARLQNVLLSKNGLPITAGVVPEFQSGQDSLGIQVCIKNDPGVSTPHVAFIIHDSNRKIIASTSTERDGVAMRRDSQDLLTASVEFTKIPLLRDEYSIDVMLLCDRGIRVVEAAYQAAEFRVTQDHPEIGVVSLPRHWH